MTPPSPYRERVVHGATLQSAVPFVTITALWLAARGVVRVAAATLSGRLQTRSASGPRACFLATGYSWAGFHTWNIQPMRFLRTSLVLSADERETLERWMRRPTTAQALAMRAQIIVHCAGGKTNTVVAEAMGLAKQTVGK